MGLLKAFRGGTAAATGSGGSDNRASVINARDSARRLELLDDLEQAGIGWIWATDSDGNLIYLSENATENMDLPDGGLLARPMASLFEIDTENPDGRADRSLKFLFAARSRIVDQVVRFVPGAKLDGARPVWWSITGLPKTDSAGQFIGYRGSARDITIAHERKVEDSRMAEFDSLTGLANRHRMNRRIDATLPAFKAAKRSCALLMLDLDRFKHVNDTMGHPAGDALLRQVAARLNGAVGARGEIGRLGGDEFQILLPDMDDRGTLGEMATRIVKLLSQPYPIEGKQAVIGASVGIAIAPYDGVEREELVHAADLALYAAKNGGRGQYRFYTADLKDEADELVQLSEDLRAALDADDLYLHYQPVVRAEDNVVVGCEALVRWNHAERGPVSPVTFIPIAEESTLINDLGAWVLRRACRDAAQWEDSVRVAVNVSAVQFASTGFVDTVANIIAETGIAPARVELELTESVFLGDNEAADEVFVALKALGVRLALDDFGTGFSSLSYLRSAPFDKIKVDRSFVDACTGQDQNSVKIISAIIGLADALGMETTVEGVEAFDQLDVVRGKGARYIQGYLYARPMPIEDLLDMLESGAMKVVPKGPQQFRADRRSVFRRVGVIHEDHRYTAIMRNLSKTGAGLEGLLGIAKGTPLVIDMGGGQLAVCTVARTQDAEFAVEFETPLVNDGAGGLCTRHRVSPYALAAAGVPLTALGHGDYPLAVGAHVDSKPAFIEVATVQAA
ncbi:MAG: hypothetical protein RLZZ58_331 [Pseudomonadota bacterium]